jgi:diaminopimelate epimerase
MRRLKFTKMQGLGNDFVVLDATTEPIELTRAQLRYLADRHFGIGCDQILQVELPRVAGTDFYYRIFNADGGEVEQCGNGARCFVRYVRDRGLTRKNEIRVGTRSGVIVPRIERDGQVTVEMGVPLFEPQDVPFEAPARAPAYALDVGGESVEVTAVSMGNPHAVQIVADVDAAPVTAQGALIEAHARFPLRVNAGYMQILGKDRIRVRVYERGAGETLACGTGACAAAAVGIVRGVLQSPRIVVETRGGSLVVSWSGEGTPITMTGPAASVFEGVIEIPPAPEAT